VMPAARPPCSVLRANGPGPLDRRDRFLLDARSLLGSSARCNRALMSRSLPNHQNW
jgi:hypothetical protein